MKLSPLDTNSVMKLAVSLIRVSNDFLEIDAIDNEYNEEKDNVVNLCHGHLVCSVALMLTTIGMNEEQVDSFIDLHSQKT